MLVHLAWLSAQEKENLDFGAQLAVLSYCSFCVTLHSSLLEGWEMQRPSEGEKGSSQEARGWKQSRTQALSGPPILQTI